MRRKDCEVSDINSILKIIGNCDVCRLGIAAENIPYIVPMSFGYEYIDNRLVFYFHSAKTGRKLDMLRLNPFVCFSMDCFHRFVAGESPCMHTINYESVHGYGKISFIEDKEQKEYALSILAGNYTAVSKIELSPAQIDAVVVLRLDAESLTGKRSFI